MRFMLIDGNSLTYRAFHALPTDLVTASGQVTNAVFGFTSMFINLVRDHKPDAIAVAFDRPEKTFRHERDPEYKANRAKSPDEFKGQVALAFPSTAALFRMGTVSALNGRPEDARLWLSRICPLIEASQCEPFRKVWAARARADTRLAAVTWPEP